jgi:hypothetical protein
MKWFSWLVPPPQFEKLDPGRQTGETTARRTAV